MWIAENTCEDHTIFGMQFSCCLCCTEFVSKECRLPYTFVEVQWPCRRLLVINTWKSAAPSCSFPHYNTRYRWWLLGCWWIQWAFKTIQHTSRANCLPQVEIDYTVLKIIPSIKGKNCGREKCNTVLLFLILRGKTVYPTQNVPYIKVKNCVPLHKMFREEDCVQAFQFTV